MHRRKDWNLIFDQINYDDLMLFIKHKNRVEPLVVLDYLLQIGAFKRDRNEPQNQYNITYIDSVNILRIIDRLVELKKIIKKDNQYRLS